MRLARANQKATRQFRLALALSRAYTRPLFTELHGNRRDPVDQGRPRDVERTKAMNASELREKTPDQLRDQLVQLKKEAFNLRFQQATGQLENTARMRVVKRDAARVKTILNEKAAAAAGTDMGAAGATEAN